jgi:hypothetical protein
MRIDHENDMAGTEPGLDALTRAGRLLQSDAPDRDAMLGHVYLRNSQFKEQPMNMISRLFAGRGPAARFAIATLLLLALGALTTFLPQRVRLVDGKPRVDIARTSYAATNGVVLTWDLSSQVPVGASAQATHDQMMGLLEQFNAIKKEAAATAPAGVEVKLVNRVEQRSKRIKRGDGGPPTEETENIVEVSFMLSAPDGTLQQAITDAVAAKLPAAGAPKVSDATWFSENGGMIEDGIHIGLHVNGSDRSFTFPDTASEEEIEAAIVSWLHENDADFPGTVDVEIESTDGPDGQKERRVEIKVETEGDEE